jgi:hypothetical protein
MIITNLSWYNATASMCTMISGDSSIGISSSSPLKKSIEVIYSARVNGTGELYPVVYEVINIPFPDRIVGNIYPCFVNTNSVNATTILSIKYSADRYFWGGIVGTVFFWIDLSRGLC